MPRVSRASSEGLCVHALSRSNGRATVFHDASDYRSFTDLVRKGSQIVKLPVLAWCVMPNHFHVVVRPDGARDLSRWMHWVLTSHVQRHRLRYQTVGRIWQGRYKAFPIQTDHHLLTVLRYVERNPVTAGLVSNARLWRWSSHIERVGAAGAALFLAPSPVELPEPWSEWVDVPLTDVEMEKLQACASRGRPFGDEAWTLGTVDRLGLQSTVRPRGRPRSQGPPDAPRSQGPPGTPRSGANPLAGRSRGSDGAQPTRAARKPGCPLF